MALLELRGLCVARGKTRIVSDVNWSVPVGAAVALLGRNGAGKSTLADGVCGFAKNWRGKVVFDGRDITGWRPDKIARAGLIQVAQNRELFPEITVRDHLKIGARAMGGRSEKSDLSVAQILDLFPRLAERSQQYAGQMSGGEQQMLAIARALAGAPRLLILDEPMTGLAPIVVDSIMNAINAIVRRELTVILIEQNVKVALSLCDDLMVLDRGRAAFNGKQSGLGASPEDALGRLYLNGDSDSLMSDSTGAKGSPL